MPEIKGKGWTGGSRTAIGTPVDMIRKIAHTHAARSIHLHCVQYLMMIRGTWTAAEASCTVDVDPSRAAMSAVHEGRQNPARLIEA